MGLGRNKWHFLSFVGARLSASLAPSGPHTTRLAPWREVLYNILIEFGIPMKLVRLIKMCLTETYSRVWVVKNLSDMFPIRNGLKQGDALLPLLFKFALEYAIRRVQVHQDGLKLDGTHQLLVNADDDNILGGSVHTIKENAEAVVVASKETGR